MFEHRIDIGQKTTHGWALSVQLSVHGVDCITPGPNFKITGFSD